MLKKLIHVIITYGTRLGNNVIWFIVQYQIILLGLLLLMISVIVCKVIYFGPDLGATQIVTKEAEKTINNITQQQFTAQQRHEIECSAVRALLKKRNPHITLAHLERELAKMTLPHEVENTRKIIECFKEKSGPNDKFVEEYIKSKKCGK